MIVPAAPRDPLDTIVAIATPPGVGAIGVVRVSGPRAWPCVRPLLERALSGPPIPRRLRRVRIVDRKTGDPIDDALVAFMPGPHSYTGEDVVEVSCHGNPVVLGAVVEGILEEGARLAEPGEFTRRAYLNDRVDLTGAEAVALLIEAKSVRAARLAMRQMSGELASTLTELRERLLDVIAGLEVALDFPEEGYGASVSSAVLVSEVVRDRIGVLLDASRRGRSVHSGLTIVITGAPNVGKSSLLNALLEQRRAIVSATPGTTRDLVEGALVMDGVWVRLVDSAGLGVARDAIDAEGMERSRSAIAEGDLVLVVLDRSRAAESEDRAVLEITRHRPRLVVANKSDLPCALQLEGVDCECSSVSAAGIAGLRRRLAEWVELRTGSDAEEGGIVASLRVSEQLEIARAALDRALDGLGSRRPVETLLIDLREARAALDATIGESLGDQVLDRIFARFCVGK